MKSCACLLVMILLCAPSLKARLGESLSELQSRYGPPSPQPFQGKLVFTKNDLSVFVLMHEDRCVQVSFFREMGELLLGEAKVLLDASGKGFAWQEIEGLARHQWKTKGGELEAVLASSFLTITDVKGLAAYEEAKSKESAAKLKGF